MERCTQCGAKMDEEAVELGICDKCGEEVEELDESPEEQMKPLDFSHS